MISVPSGLREAALTLARVALGVTFMAHGYMHTNMVGKAKNVAGFEQMGVPLPELSYYAQSAACWVGGFLLIIGLLQPLVGVVLAASMAGAWILAHGGGEFFVSKGGPELVLVLGTTALAIGFAGGRWSVDGLLASRRAG
ncbi:DoxX family protein [Pseudonocardiaceae bacterium YIM PH 21723]|nr:DoxX family protein [Pseudonocardiaceae bacterium YIM PH 21723]